MSYNEPIMGMALYDEILKETKGLEKVIGVAVKHLGTGETASFNGDELYPTASVFKVPVIIELYRQAETGLFSLNDKITLKESDKVPGSGILKELSEGLEITVRDLARLMMILSDNTATDILLGKATKEKVNNNLRRLGLTKTTVNVGCRDILFDLVGVNDLPDSERTLTLFNEKSKTGVMKGTWSLGTDKNNVTTPTEMNNILELLAEGKVARRGSCEEITSIMDKCQTGEYRIPKYLPTDKVKMTRKTGSIPGIRNDTGIITILDTGERYCISCFTKGAPDVYVAEEAIAKVSRNVYQYFTKNRQ